MTVEDIFKELSAHMIKGIMTHEELANYYDFLGLKGYRKCHEYHFYSESKGYRELCKYYISHYNKLIPETKVEQPEVIPESWYPHVREDVDSATKKNAARSGLSAWIEWEQSTKSLYQQHYKNLINIGEIASAKFLCDYICDVDEELKTAEEYMLNKQATNFDLAYIIEEQKDKHDKYGSKIRCLMTK